MWGTAQVTVTPSEHGTMESLIEYIGKEIKRAFNVTQRDIRWSSFRLYDDNIVITSTNYLRHGQQLQFHIPYELQLTSPSNWTQQQLVALNIQFEDCNNAQFDNILQKEFDVKEVKYDISSNVAAKLAGLSADLLHTYEKQIEQLRASPYTHSDSEIVNHSSFSSPISSSPTSELLLHPLTKSLYMLHKYYRQESGVDSFVFLLLNELGFNLQYLYVFPRLKLDLTIKDAKLESTADFTLLDVCSFLRMAVVEDKSVQNEMIISEPQMIGELVAMQQANKLKIEQQVSDKPDAKKQKLETQDNKLLAIRVNGCNFQFYFIEMSNELMKAVQQGKGSCKLITV